jgi:hypothetical protein
MPRTSRKNLVKAIEDAQKASEEREKRQVSTQPHRRGVELPMSQMAGSELGRFILLEITSDMCFERNSKMSLDAYRNELMDSCESYAKKMWKWCIARGVPLPANIAWDFSNDPPDDDDVAENVGDWLKAIEAYEKAMKCAGLTAFGAVRNLILFDREQRREMHPSIRRAMQSLHAVIYS